MDLGLGTGGSAEDNILERINALESKYSGKKVQRKSHDHAFDKTLAFKSNDLNSRILAMQNKWSRHNIKYSDATFSPSNIVGKNRWEVGLDNMQKKQESKEQKKYYDSLAKKDASPADSWMPASVVAEKARTEREGNFGWVAENGARKADFSSEAVKASKKGSAQAFAAELLAQKQNKLGAVEDDDVIAATNALMAKFERMSATIDGPTCPPKLKRKKRPSNRPEVDYDLNYYGTKEYFMSDDYLEAGPCFKHHGDGLGLGGFGSDDMDPNASSSTSRFRRVTKRKPRVKKGRRVAEKAPIDTEYNELQDRLASGGGTAHPAADGDDYGDDDYQPSALLKSMFGDDYSLGDDLDDAGDHEYGNADYRPATAGLNISVKCENTDCSAPDQAGTIFGCTPCDHLLCVECVRNAMSSYRELSYEERSKGPKCMFRCPICSQNIASTEAKGYQ